MSQRKQIRADIVALLMSGVPEVSSRVFSSRAEAVADRAELPCICVYTREEQVTTHSEVSRSMSRDLKLAVELLLHGSGAIDDDIDDLCEKVERALLVETEAYPDAKSYRSIQLESTEIGYTDQGRRPLAAARLNFGIEYESTI